MSSVARRYAKAVFSLAEGQGEIERVGRELQSAAAELGLPDLSELASSPRLSSERRRALVQAVADQLSLASLVTTFLHVLADHHRLRELASIADHFQRFEDQALGRVRITIRSATPLSDAERDQVADAFSRELQRQVIARSEVDPRLLGGIVVEAEGKVYDGSVRSNVERLAKHMAHPDTH